jgi:hypothetical protein
LREEALEVALLGCGEPGSDLPVVFAGDVAQLGHQLAPQLGQVKCVEASVCVVAFAGDVPAGLKFVDEGHDPAGPMRTRGVAGCLSLCRGGMVTVVVGHRRRGPERIGWHSAQRRADDDADDEETEHHAAHQKQRGTALLTAVP